MPLAPNPLIVGRGDELLQVAAALRGRNITMALSQVVASTGLGRLGKTQLAVELVHRYGCFFAGGVFWLSFASADEIPIQVAACAGPGAMDLAPGIESRPVGGTSAARAAGLAERGAAVAGVRQLRGGGAPGALATGEPGLPGAGHHAHGRLTGGGGVRGAEATTAVGAASNRRRTAGGSTSVAAGSSTPPTDYTPDRVFPGMKPQSCASGPQRQSSSASSSVGAKWPLTTGSASGGSVLLAPVSRRLGSTCCHICM